MTTSGLYTAEELYALLPSVYRTRDAAEGQLLRGFVEIVTEQANVIAESLDQMYDDAFVETCADWAAAYIGELIGYRTLHGVVPKVASPRAEVANTIRYRRRKGTVAVVEELARDVTGWPARAVEYFELLTATQYMNHVRPHAAATASLRGAIELEVGDGFQAGAFDELAHTAEMRDPALGSGRYNIPNIGIFLWRIHALRRLRSPLVAADGTGRRYRFDPLGTDGPLFAAPRTETEISHVAEVQDVPIPLPRRWLGAHLRDYYGEGRSLLLERSSASGFEVVPASDVRICDLSDDPGAPGQWAHEPQAGDTHVAVDPVLGRVAFAEPPPSTERRFATFHYGSALLAGGGGYARTPAEPGPPTDTAAGGGPLDLTVVAGGGILEVQDNEEYALPSSVTVTTPPSGSEVRAVVLRSSPTTWPLVEIPTQLKLDMEPDTEVVLDGLLLTGGTIVMDEFPDARPRTVVLRHSTLVPGLARRPDGTPSTTGVASLIVLHPFAEVHLDHCVVGPVVAVEGAKVTATDSVIDATAPDEIAFCGRPAPSGGAVRTVASADDLLVGSGTSAGGDLNLEACTVVGRLHAQTFEVSDSVLLARPAAGGDPWPPPIWAERTQTGCIRFSYVPPGSRTPRRYRCVGDDPRHVPHLTSLRYGDPAYGQLRPSTHRAVRMGSSDESEMGVTRELYHPQREANLKIRLDEYLRYGLKAGMFYAT